MRIHVSTIVDHDWIQRAARVARVNLEVVTEHASRCADHAFEIKLTGESRRRPNGGSYGAGDDYAATWDQWGVFLAELFILDPKMICGTHKNPTYAGVEDFNFKTGHRFDPEDRTSGWGNTWPSDAHGDHTFRYQGVPFQQSCTKCSATRNWTA